MTRLNVTFRRLNVFTLFEFCPKDDHRMDESVIREVLERLDTAWNFFTELTDTLLTEVISYFNFSTAVDNAKAMILKGTELIALL